MSIRKQKTKRACLMMFEYKMYISISLVHFSSTLFNLIFYSNQCAFKGRADGLGIFPTLSLLWTARKVEQETLPTHTHKCHTKHEHHIVKYSLLFPHRHQDSCLASSGFKSQPCLTSSNICCNYK